MLTGRQSDLTAAESVIKLGCFGVLLVPAAVFACVLMFVGARAWQYPREWGELKVVFFAGIAVLGAVALLAYYALQYVPQQTVREFTLEESDGDHVLTVLTSAFGTERFPVAAVQSVHAVRHRRSRRVAGWWLKLRRPGTGGVRWAFVDAWLQNGNDLIDLLERLAGVKVR